MFKENKYTKWYYKIISNPDLNAVYFEKHHILPKSLGGGNEEANIVSLSARQHFVCHLLLPKMCIEKVHIQKMSYALKCLATFSRKDTPRYVPKSSRIFELCRNSTKGIPKSERAKKNIKAAAQNRKRRGPFTETHCYNISQSQKGKIISQEQRKKISETLKGRDTYFKGKQHRVESLEKMSNSQKARVRPPKGQIKHSAQAIENNKQAQLKYIYTILSPTGERIVVSDVKAFCAKMNFPYSAFSNKKRIGKIILPNTRHKNPAVVGWALISVVLR